MRSKKKIYNITILGSIFAIILQFIFILAGNGNLFIDVVCLLSYIALMLSILRLDPRQLIKYFYFIFVSSWSVLAVFLMENGTVTVAGDSANHYGSFVLYNISWLIFYLVIAYLEKKYGQRNPVYYTKVKESGVEKTGAIRTMRLILIIATAVELIAFLSIITKPYFIFGVDRVAYANSGAMPSWLNGHVGFFSLMIPLAVCVLEDDKILPSIYMAIFVLLNIWIGEKFSGIFLGIYFFVFSYVGLYGFKIKTKTIKKIIYIVGVLLVVLVGLVYFQMTTIQGRAFGYYFKERISANGYIWWLTYVNDSHKGFHLNELFDELYPFVSKLSGKMSDYNFGIYKLMKLYYAPERWRPMLEYGFRGAESTRATFYYYGKIPGLIFGQVILAFLTYFISSKCYKYLKQKNYIKIIFGFYVMRNFIAAFSMSDFYLLLEIKVIIAYIILIFGDKLNFNFKLNVPKVRFGRRRTYQRKE